MEKTTGLYRFTQISVLYHLFQNLLGADRFQQKFAHEINAGKQDRLLDLGCGPAAILQYLEVKRYVGIDRNANHIRGARSRYGIRGDFYCGDFSLAKDLEEDGFDIIICLGLLHHLDDMQVQNIAALAHDLLTPNGRFLTVDPAFISNQNPIARKLAAADSGQHVRRPENYQKLVGSAFSSVGYTLHHDLLRVPYTHCITQSRKGPHAAESI